MWYIDLKNPILYEASWKEVLDSVLTEVTDQKGLLLSNHKNLWSSLLFSETKLLSADQKVESKIPWAWLKKMNETENKPQRDVTFGPSKTFTTKKYWAKFALSDKMTAFIKKGWEINRQWLDIQSEFLNIPDLAEDLILWADITLAEDISLVLTKWFSVSAGDTSYGSACARDWQPLFSASHKLKTWTTFSNLVTSSPYADIATWTKVLQDSINMLKSMRFDNWKKISWNKWYKLVCSVEKEVFWKQVLNDWSNFSWQGSNANQLNQFNFKWNIVELVVLPTLWDPSENWVIWNQNMFFVMNTQYIQWAKALKYAYLTKPTINTWENEDSNMTFIWIRQEFAVWHFDAELWIVWYAWV